MKDKNVFIPNADISWETVGVGVRRKIMAYDKSLMLVRVEFSKASIGALHHHYHSQISYVETGVFEVEIQGVKKIVKAGSPSLSGRLYDKIGTRLGFVISITVWSIAAMLHAGARGVLSFSLFRSLLGLGEAGNWPGAAKSNAEWFPIPERAFTQGIFNAGAFLGAVISAPLIAYFYATVGWQRLLF